MMRQNNKPANNLVERITFEKNKRSLFHQNIKDTCVVKNMTSLFEEKANNNI